jgi:hypothetical protein
MDIHKPKPIHSWRDFIKEIGIIVLGVSIALSAEQAVEFFHWKNKLAEAEAGMRKELGDDDGPQAVERLRISKCIEAELNAAQKGLLDSRDHGAPLMAVKLTAPAFHSWDADAWHAAVASDVTTRMPTLRMYNWSSPYALIPDMDQAALRETNAWASLRVIEVAPAHPSPDETAHLLQLIADTRGANDLMKTMSETFLHYVALAGVQMTEAQQRLFLARDQARWPACSFSP